MAATTHSKHETYIMTTVLLSSTLLRRQGMSESVIRLPLYSRTDLLHEATPAILCSSITLIRLTQERIEWLPHPNGDGRCRIAGDSKGSNVGQLLEGVLAGSSSLEDIRMDEVLHHSLEHGRRLIEVHL